MPGLRAYACTMPTPFIASIADWSCHYPGHGTGGAEGRKQRMCGRSLPLSRRPLVTTASTEKTITA